MLLWFLKPLRHVVGMFRDLNSPRQIACGVALGMLVGFVPKDNLTAVVLGVLLCALRVNLAAGSLSALLCSWIAVGLGPVFDRVGFALLRSASLQPYWIDLFERPWAPWTGLNNTVALGGLVLGLSLFYPVYHIVSRLLSVFTNRYSHQLSEKLKRYKLYHVLVGADLASGWSWKV